MRLHLKQIALMLLMLVSAVLALYIKPTVRIADHKPAIKLENIIPDQFGEWQVVKQGIQQIVNPQQAQILNQLYSQTLSRTYVNASGYSIMLSIAYGGDQTKDLGVHRPEVCYSAQGFQLNNTSKVILDVSGNKLPAMRLQTSLGQRREPITYWIRIGDKIIRGNLEQGVARLLYGIRGKIPDGLLFRVSSIDSDSDMAYEHHDAFIRALYAVIAQQDKSSIFGMNIK